MNEAFQKNYGDIIVKMYRASDSSLDELFENIKKFKNGIEFNRAWQTDFDVALWRVKEALAKLHQIESLIIEMEGNGYGD